MIVIDNLNFVAIGGGTGLSMILSGLKEFTSNITAIVTVADDGGSSGLLRQDLNILPPGDIRDCMLALADTEKPMKKLFNYRFDTGTLKGQNFGNLLIAAMTKIYGDFSTAIKETSGVLNITGEVLPVTLDRMDIVARLKNGTVVKGESAIPKISIKENSPIDRLYLSDDRITLLSDCIDAIEKADIIVIGPGSLYTSILPNLLVHNMAEAITNSKAKVIYIANAVTEAGETDGYSIYDHVQTIINHTKDGIIDYVLAHNLHAEKTVVDSYKEGDMTQILPTKEDRNKLEEMGIQLIEGEFATIIDDKIRHEPKQLSKCIMEIASSQLV